MLEKSIGKPPFLYYRTLSYLLLLLHINTAAHMALPVEESSTNSLDILQVYEEITRFCSNIILNGLIVTLKPEKGKKPFITLSAGLQGATNLLKHGLPIPHFLTTTRFAPTYNAVKSWMLPPMLRDTDGFINDAVFAPFWPDLKDSVIASLRFIRDKSRTTESVTKVVPQKVVAEIVYRMFGMPKKLTKTILMLSKEQDFWDLVHAVQEWFNSHQGIYEVQVKQHSPLMLPSPGENPPDYEPPDWKTRNRISSSEDSPRPSKGPGLFSSPHLTTFNLESSIDDLVQEDYRPHKNNPFSSG